MNFKSAILAAALALFAGDAKAVVFDVTYTGIVGTNSTDAGGVFGVVSPAPGAYAGMSYVATLRFDSTLGNNLSSPYAGKEGGTDYGVPSPFISGSYSLNGTTLSMGGGTRDAFGTSSNFNSILHTAYYFDGVGGTYFYAESAVTGSPLTLVGPATYGPGDLDSSIVLFSFSDGVTEQTVIRGITQTLTIAPVVAAVPEPSTWAMMILGFAGIAFATHRRKIQTV